MLPAALLGGSAVATYATVKRLTRPQKEPSSLLDPNRHITVVTTAALPWMTGTAVNPLLRAAYLAKDGRKVTLVLPWLCDEEQRKLFPKDISFESPDQKQTWMRESMQDWLKIVKYNEQDKKVTFPSGMAFSQPEQQAEWMKDWVHSRTGIQPDFDVRFYKAHYDPLFMSIMPSEDITQLIQDFEADVAILEEPEHLTWFHTGQPWSVKFNHVVGIMHTNYVDYIQRQAGWAVAKQMKGLNSLLCSIHCHKVVKLSDAVQGAYFLGKAVWGKGFTELLDLAEHYKTATGNKLPMDVFGSGDDEEAIRTAAKERSLTGDDGREGLCFHDGRDHTDAHMHGYQAFINPSTSDVVATTSAEALAMGKWVVCADHVENAFFRQFDNCLQYSSPEEFVSMVDKATSEEPAPLSDAARQLLTWEDATERLLKVGSISSKEWPSPAQMKLGNGLWFAYRNSRDLMYGVRSALKKGQEHLSEPAVTEKQTQLSIAGLALG